MNILFRNKGVLSLLDMITMGDSVKREDSSKIGKFDSGLKYAISILHRNGIELEIFSGNSKYKFETRIIHDEVTTKVKEVICIVEDRYSSEGSKRLEHITAFSPNLGYEWKVWMAIRELYANTLDEGGDVEFTDVEIPWFEDNETVVLVKDNSLLPLIIENWGNYFLPSDLTPIHEQGGVKIYSNPSNHLKLYKNHILIFEDRNVNSRFVYDYPEASIDEMRMLNDKGNYDFNVMYSIIKSKDIEFIENIINFTNENYYESNLEYCNSFSQEWIDFVNKRYLERKVVGTCKSLFHAFMECKHMDVGVKNIKHSPTLYSWNNQVKVEKELEPELTFEGTIKEIASKYNFTIKYPIEESRISGYNCVADVDAKVLYISRKFKEKDMWELVKAQFRIEGNDDPNYVYREYIKLLNKV